jgi:hypothetical protein
LRRACLGGPRLDDVSLGELDVAALDGNGQPLWELVTPGSAERIRFNTTAVGVTLMEGDLVRDTRANLATGDVVLVDRPALYGYFRYTGPAGRLDLLLSDFGRGADAALWSALADGSQNAPLTPQKLPADRRLQPGALVRLRRHRGHARAEAAHALHELARGAVERRGAALRRARVR